MRKLLRTALLSTALLAGCGSDSGEGQAPTGSTVTINPQSIEWEVAGSYPFEFLKTLYNVSVTGPGGSPIRGADVDIYLDLAPGSIVDPVPVFPPGLPGGVIPTGMEVLYLADGTDTLQNVPFRMRTDDFGNIRLYVYMLVGGGLEYRGYLQAFSGSAFTNSEITITCVDSDTNTPECD